MAKSTAHKTRRRSPGEGSVYRFGTRWRGAVQWTELDGSRSRRIVNAATSEEARDLLDELRRDLRLGTIAPAGRAVTVGEYLTGWIERNRTRVRPSTWRQRESHVRVYLNPALGRTTLTRLSAADVERAIASFMKGGRPVTQEDRKRGRQKHLPISAQTARHIRVTLRIALGDAARDRLVSRNAAADARPPHLPHKPITFLSASEVWTLLDATEEAEFGPLYSVAAMSGLRMHVHNTVGCCDVLDDDHEGDAEGAGNLIVVHVRERSRDPRVLAPYAHELPSREPLDGLNWCQVES